MILIPIRSASVPGATVIAVTLSSVSWSTRATLFSRGGVIGREALPDAGHVWTTSPACSSTELDAGQTFSSTTILQFSF